jgi:hypothetical protein
LTVDPEIKPLPVIVMDVPPAAGPLLGPIDVIVGAVANAELAPAKRPVAQHNKTAGARMQNRILYPPLKSPSRSNDPYLALNYKMLRDCN